jgi:hypothetical protein
MSNWKDKLEEYDREEKFEDELKAFDELLESDEELKSLIDDAGKALAEYLDNLENSEGEPDMDDDTNLLEYIFGNEEIGRDFIEWDKEQRKGTYLLDISKVQKANDLKELVKTIFGEDAEISVGEPDIQTNFISVTATGKHLIVNNPKMFWYIATEVTHSVDACEKLDDTVEISFGINDVAIKIGD